MTAQSSQPVPRLGGLEQQVMDLLWEYNPRSVRDDMDALPHSPAYATIATVVQTLRTKAMVNTQHGGRSAFYLPTCSGDGYVARLMHDALGSSHYKAASILHFVQEMPEDGLAMLRDYLEQT